jgi:hypothetical protein
MGHWLLPYTERRNGTYCLRKISCAYAVLLHEVLQLQQLEVLQLQQLEVLQLELHPHEAASISMSAMSSISKVSISSW